MTRGHELSRRRFIKATAATAALASLPAASWARVPGANERIHVGVVGTGGQGTGLTRNLVRRADADNVAVDRVCDVYRRRLNNAVQVIGGTSDSGTMEYREVLDNRDLDAIVIATPDHWHTKIAIEAMDSGKDVYCEKPLSLTIRQALDCRNAVKRTGRKLQVGPQGTSEDRWWQCQKAIKRGRIGKVTWSQGSYCRNSRGGQFNWHIDPDAGPKNTPDQDGYVWWERWLGAEHGLAEDIPWNADHFFRFRKYFAYNGGVATDLLYHRLAPLLLAVSGPNGEYPRRVVASGGRYLEKDERDIPDTFMMMVEYPSEHSVVLVSVMTNDVGVPYIIRGQHATLNFEDGIRAQEQGVWSDDFRKNNAEILKYAKKNNEAGEEVDNTNKGQAYFTLDTAPRRDHMGNFLDAVRDEAPLHCNIDLGCSTMVAIKMGVEAYRQDKVMLWDNDREEMIVS